MPVYSANRMGSIGGSRYINENYSTLSDLSRVMAEAVQGDLDLFEAFVCSDIAEATAIKRGYFTEADDEVKEAGEKAGNAIIKFFQTLWEKIVNIIRGIGERIKAAWNSLFGKKEAKEAEAKANEVLEKAKTDSAVAEKVGVVFAEAENKWHVIAKDSLNRKFDDFKRKCDDMTSVFNDLQSGHNELFDGVTDSKERNKLNKTMGNAFNQGKMATSMKIKERDENSIYIGKQIFLTKTLTSLEQAIDFFGLELIRKENIKGKNATQIKEMTVEKNFGDQFKALSNKLQTKSKEIQKILNGYSNAIKKGKNEVAKENLSTLKTVITKAVNGLGMEASTFAMVSSKNSAAVSSLIKYISNIGSTREEIEKRTGKKLYSDGSTSAKKESAMLEMLMCIYEAEAEVDDVMEAPIEDVIEDNEDADTDVDIDINIGESSSLFGSYSY